MRNKHALRASLLGGLLFASQPFAFHITTPSEPTVNEEDPGSLEIAVNEGTLGRLELSAKHEDLDVTATTTFTLPTGHSGLFTLATGGKVLLFDGDQEDADTEQNTDYSVLVTARRSVGNLNATRTIVVKLKNINDNAPTNVELKKLGEDYINGANPIPENISTPLELATVSATDNDKYEDNGLLYTLEGTNLEYFNLVSVPAEGSDKVSKATLTLEKSPDYENIKELKIKISVSDGKYQHTSNDFIFKVGNENDIAPSKIKLTSTDTSNPNKRSIVENDTRNLVLGSFSTEDGDLDEEGNGDTFHYELVDNVGGYFRITEDKLRLTKAIDYEAIKSISAHIMVLDGEGRDTDQKITGHTREDTFTFTIEDRNDTAPTNTQLSKATVIKGTLANVLIGSLSADDPDTDETPTTFSLNGHNKDDFKIEGNQLRTNVNFDQLEAKKITITPSDGINTGAVKAFTIDVINDPTVVPVIKKFIVTQDNKKGQVISKAGGVVTVEGVAIAQSYEWSSKDFIFTNGKSNPVSFNPGQALGTKMLKLKVSSGQNSSERELQLTVVKGSVAKTDEDRDGDGIPDSSDPEAMDAPHGMHLGQGKHITSPKNTRMLLGVAAKDSEKDSALITLANMKGYIVANNLNDNSQDSVTTGDIYDYVVEGLSIAGKSIDVMISLAKPIPENAKLRRYSLKTGWDEFRVDANNKIQSHESSTCTTVTTWTEGLKPGNNCIKLMIKDGGENDTDGEQADNRGSENGVITSTVSIAVPKVEDVETERNQSSKGGCVYNPNAKGGLGIEFLFFLALSGYYLVRRKTASVK